MFTGEAGVIPAIVVNISIDLEDRVISTRNLFHLGLAQFVCVCACLCCVSVFVSRVCVCVRICVVCEKVVLVYKVTTVYRITEF